jgi:hypothetical protein
MPRIELQLELLPGSFSIVQLAPDSKIPHWAEDKEFCSVTRTSEELSLVVPAGSVPEDITVEKGWNCLRVRGTLDFKLTGVLADLSAPLAREGIPVFVVSTFNTDYLFVKSASLKESLQVLKSSGYSVLPAVSR